MESTSDQVYIHTLTNFANKKIYFNQNFILESSNQCLLSRRSLLRESLLRLRLLLGDRRSLLRYFFLLFFDFDFFERRLSGLLEDDDEDELLWRRCWDDERFLQNKQRILFENLNSSLNKPGARLSRCAYDRRHRDRLHRLIRVIAIVS